MDSPLFLDVLLEIFDKFPFNKNIYLVCKFWYALYKYTITTRDIEVIYKNNPTQKISVYCLYIENSNIKDFTNFIGIRNLCMFNCKEIDNLSLPSLDGLIKLHIRMCSKITELPYFIHLKYLNMTKCQVADISVLGNMRNLKYLNISECNNITILPKFSNLVVLDAVSCIGLTDISNISSTNLKKLNLSYSKRINNLPYCENLTRLGIESACSNLYSIDKVMNMTKLKYLNISEYKEDFMISKLCNPRELYIDRCNGATNIFENYKGTNLEILTIKKSNNITGIPGHLENLRRLNIYLCENIKNIKVLKNSNNLYDISYTGGVKKLPVIKNLRTLYITNINITNLSNLSSNLRNLYLEYCDSIVELPKNLENLEILTIISCNNINNIDASENYKKLICLNISYCDYITKLVVIDNLRIMHINSCINIININILAEFKKLVGLTILRCNNIKILPKLENIKKISITGCINLIDINNIGMELEYLSIIQCNKIKYLPMNVGKLKEVFIIECKKLRDISVLENASNLLYIEISNREIIIPESIAKNKRIKILII